MTEEWWFWAAVGGGGAILLGVIIGVSVHAATSQPRSVEAPIEGDFTPGVIRW